MPTNLAHLQNAGCHGSVANPCPTEQPAHPSAPPFADEVLQCIHCGLCATFCPTYREMRTEMQSPRGRIHLARAVMEGRLRLTREVFNHLDLCLDCRACQTACPSGVHYGALLEKVRAWPEYRRARPLLERLAMAVAMRWIIPSQRGLRAGGALLRLYRTLGIQFLVRRTGLARLLPRRLRAAEALLPAEADERLPPLPEVVPAKGERRARVALLSGCVMDIMLRSVNWATVEVLALNGCEVITPRGQRCCGGLHVHQGETEAARELARHNVDVFERAQVGAVITNAAGCGSTMKEYPELLADDPVYAKRAAALANRTRDISEFLISLPLIPPNRVARVAGQPVHSPDTPTTNHCLRVAYDEPCHLVHGQQISAQPRELLRSIPGVELVELKESDWCCGSAGVYNIAHPHIADALLARKLAHIEAADVDVVASGNIGCLLQLAKGIRERGLDIRVAHPIELLQEAYEASAKDR